MSAPAPEQKHPLKTENPAEPIWLCRIFCVAPKAEETFPPDCLVSQRGSEDGLMVCMRFSASSKTMERGPSKTSSVTSSASRWDCSLIWRPMPVLRSWNAGRQCMEQGLFLRRRP